MSNRLFSTLAGAALLLLAAATAPAAERLTVKTVVPATARNRFMGRLPANKQMHLAIGLPFRNRDVLTNLIHRMYTRNSPSYRAYLTPDQFAERFGPTEEDYQGVKDFAASNGLQVVREFGNRALLSVTGRVADIEKAFHVHMGLYQHPTEDRQFFAPDVDPTVDSTLPVLYVSGIDNFIIPRRQGHRVDLHKAVGGGQSGGSYPGGLYIGSDFRNAYAPGVANTGSGQVVGLFEFDGYTLGDIQLYESTAHITDVPVLNVLDTFTPGSGNDEVASDIELVIAMAPGIKQVSVYEGNTDTEIITALATTNTTQFPLPKQISCSWGIEGDPNIEQGLMQIGAQGQSFCYAIGDNGAYANGVNTGTEQDLIYMTAVGGTQLFMNGSGASWQSEVVWHDTPGTNYNYFASTGGVLGAVPIPFYQQGLSMSLNQGSTQDRNVPDVAMVARDIEIVFTGTNAQGQNVPGQFSGWVGTSAASPLFAGFIALANQEAANNGQPPIGFLNPAIYDIAESPLYSSCYHDITNGNNSWSDPNNHTSSDNLYPSAVGYDLCTGWGSPTGASLIDALVGYSGPIFVNFNYSGTQNGSYAKPFNTIKGATNAVASGGTIIIETAGSSSETPTITKPLTITANNGPGTIGN